MIRLLFTGDIMLSRNVGKMLDLDSPQSIFSDGIIDEFDNVDLVIGNLECPVSQNAHKFNDKSFKANPNHLKYIKNFDLVSLSNNHILDCGIQGVKDTISNLDKFNIGYNGISFDHIIKPFTININGKSISFLSCLDYGSFNNYGQNSNVKPYNASDSDIYSVVNELSRLNDIVVMLIHGDNEMISYPSPKFRRLCKKFINEGADLVISNHPHVIGGYENYKNGKIFYSLGDFVFDGESNIRRKSCMLKIEINDGKFYHQIIPSVISDKLYVSKASKIDKNRINHNYNKISKSLKDNSYNKKFKYRFIRSLFNFQLDRLIFLFKNKGLIHMLIFIFKKITLLKHYFKLVLKQ